MPKFARPVLAANWKMNHAPEDAARFVEAFTLGYGVNSAQSVVLFPSALSFGATRAALGGRKDIALGVQNVHAEEKGAFTGENSARIAAGAGAGFVLVGHSERRHVFGETDAETAKKCARVREHGMTPVLCVGEKLEEREAGNTESVVLRQLRAGVSLLDSAAISEMIIAYEPVWAIGTGLTATPGDAAAVHAAIRAELQVAAPDAASDMPILYGGSVTPQNAASLLAAANVDGLLVGGASLDAASWIAICRAKA